MNLRKEKWFRVGGAFVLTNSEFLASLAGSQKGIACISAARPNWETPNLAGHIM
jgi:hypothetical protein